MGDNELSSQTLPRPFQTQLRLVEPPQPKNTASGVLHRASAYPEMRYMGSKHRLITWIHEILSSLDFESAWDPFSGSGCVAYLMKSMGKRVLASDFLNFPTVVAKATIENSRVNLDGPAVKTLLSRSRTASNFIESTYGGIFFTSDDLRFLDQVSANISALENPHHRAVAMAALLRSCLKKQPRGVFTVSGDLTSYDDGRRDLRLTLEEHFIEQIDVFNSLVFDNGRRNRALNTDVFTGQGLNVDLVYLDPPYVPRSDDNCYIKRYHFLEGLSCYWRGLEIDYSTKVRKVKKRFTPFSYRRTAISAFDDLFSRFRKSMIVLSYSSNGFPDLPQLESLLKKYKRTVRVFEKAHRYHFGNHSAVSRADTIEYLIVGQ